MIYPWPSKHARCVNYSKIFLFLAIKNVEQAKQNFEEELSRLANWWFLNQLLINLGKRKFILSGTRHFIKKLPFEMRLNFLAEVIRPVTSAKATSHFTFHSHTPEDMSSCMSKLCQIIRVEKNVSIWRHYYKFYLSICNE